MSVTKKPKLTKWFDGSVKPVRDGVYQRNFQMGVVYAKFKNGKWRVPSASIQTANKQRSYSIVPHMPWRGLAQNPEVQP